MTNEPQVTPEQLAQERSIRFALLADLGVLALFVPVGLLGGSLTIKAEAIRFLRRGLMIDPRSQVIAAELHQLGVRRRPLLRFLRRQHPLNRWCGILWQRLRRAAPPLEALRTS